MGSTSLDSRVLSSAELRVSGESMERVDLLPRRDLVPVGEVTLDLRDFVLVRPSDHEVIDFRNEKHEDFVEVTGLSVAVPARFLRFRQLGGCKESRESRSRI